MERFIDYLVPVLIVLFYFMSGRKKKVMRPPAARPIPASQMPKKIPVPPLQRKSLPTRTLGVSKASSHRLTPPQTRRVSRVFRLWKELPHRKDAVILSEILNRRDV